MSYLGNTLKRYCTIFHNTTFGSTWSINKDDFPEVGHCCLIGTGSILLGKVKVKDRKKISAGSIIIEKGR